MKRAYEAWNPSGPSLALVRTAEAICDEYRADGYTLTLRQLYYQFVARDQIPNSDKSYKRLGATIDRARKAGRLPWDMIEDRTRNLAGLPAWPDPAGRIRSAARSYNVDHWTDQPVRVEVWVEKEALAGIVQAAASRWDVDWFSCRGYPSQSEMWSAAQRLGGYIEHGQRVVILHLGDHDPSGIDMTRDIRDRLERFVLGDAGERLGWGSVLQWPAEGDDDPVDNRYAVTGELIEEYNRAALVVRGGDPDRDWTDDDDIEWCVSVDDEFDELLEVRRIALNMDQVRQYDPPPNPAKITDSRATGYIDRYGRESWELDALSPRTLEALIENHIAGIVNMDRYEARDAYRDEGLAQLAAVVNRWTDVVEFVGGES